LKHSRRRGCGKGARLSRCGPSLNRFEMTSEPKEIGSANHLAARLPEVELAVILCSVIESIEHHPAPLRNAVYELARLKLRKEACLTHSPINLSRLTLALESAIESVETIYSTRHDGLRKPRELMGACCRPGRSTGLGKQGRRNQERPADATACRYKSGTRRPETKRMWILSS
jgi:hypothetical protein